MDTVKEEDIRIVTSALEEFLSKILATTSFNRQEFFNFMEERFTRAGYREKFSNGDKTKILILTELGVGDFVVTTPAIREIRRIYPNAYIVLLVSPNSLQIAETCPYVDEIVIDTQRKIFGNLAEIYSSELPMTARLLKYRFDICYAFGVHISLPLLMYMSGAKNRIAIPEKNFFVSDYFSRLATQIFSESNYSNHRTDRFLAPLDKMLMTPVENRKLEVWYTAWDFSVAKNFTTTATRPLYAFTFGGVRRGNHYPPEKYARLLELIINSEPTATFAVLGGGETDLNSAEIFKNAVHENYRKNIIDLTNKISYRQSAAVLSLCDFYIGNDTGTMHVAAAVGCPVLEVCCFPADVQRNDNDTPNIWYAYGVPTVIVQPANALPECSKNEPHDRHGCRVSNQPHCITQIKPEILLNALKILKERVTKKNNLPIYVC